MTDAPGSRPPHRRSHIYDPVSGKLDVKRLVAWVVAITAALAAFATLGSQAESAVRWWLEVDELKADIADCHLRIDAIDDELGEHLGERDPNTRLDEALPIVTSTLREHREDIRGLRGATTRLSTIHEYGLDRSSAMAAAREAQQVMTPAPMPTPPTAPPSLVRSGTRPWGMSGAGSSAMRAQAHDGDPLAGLEGL